MRGGGRPASHSSGQAIHAGGRRLHAGWLAGGNSRIPAPFSACLANGRRGRPVETSAGTRHQVSIRSAGTSFLLTRVTPESRSRTSRLAQGKMGVAMHCPQRAECDAPALRPLSAEGDNSRARDERFVSGDLRTRLSRRSHTRHWNGSACYPKPQFTAMGRKGAARLRQLGPPIS